LAQFGRQRNGNTHSVIPQFTSTRVFYICACGDTKRDLTHETIARCFFVQTTTYCLLRDIVGNRKASTVVLLRLN